MAKKKKKTHGDSMIYRIAHNDPQEIIDWFNAQSNFSESIRILIAKDIREKNGQIEDLRFASVLSHNQTANTYIQPKVNQIITPDTSNDELISGKDVEFEVDIQTAVAPDTQDKFKDNEVVTSEKSEEQLETEKEETNKRTNRKRVERNINIANW